jgi:hypothetical protein
VLRGPLRAQSPSSGSTDWGGSCPGAGEHLGVAKRLRSSASLQLAPRPQAGAATCGKASRQGFRSRVIALSPISGVALPRLGDNDVQQGSEGAPPAFLWPPVPSG